jgi:hypothetical protein
MSIASNISFSIEPQRKFGGKLRYLQLCACAGGQTTRLPAYSLSRVKVVKRQSKRQGPGHT